jgi:hypothetical protein
MSGDWYSSPFEMLGTVTNMNRLNALLFLTIVCFSGTSLAEESPVGGEGKGIEKNTAPKGSLLSPVIAGGLSYPLILSVSGGVMLALGRSDDGINYPSVPALRAEAELGLGGASVSAGLFVPVGDFAINVKGSRMHTWLGGASDKFDGRTYDGVVVELVVDGHMPGKIGIGYFKDRDQDDSHDYRFTSISVGIGW